MFQTVHHDLWDMDVPAQPALIDLPIGGATVPALVQTTKTGNIFVLDRRTGKPIVPGHERAVPGNAAPGDRVSPTQPFSALTLMPLARVREADMWGATMLDQLGCRIAFRKLRYDGAVHAAFDPGQPGLSRQFWRDGLGRHGLRPGARPSPSPTPIIWRSPPS